MKKPRFKVGDRVWVAAYWDEPPRVRELVIHEIASDGNYVDAQWKLFRRAECFATEREAADTIFAYYRACHRSLGRKFLAFVASRKPEPEASPAATK